MIFAEIKRVLFNKKFLLLFLIILILQGIFFCYQCNDKRNITATSDELTEYINTYHDTVENALSNADIMLNTPLFSQQDSFVMNNLQKTKEDYKNLLDVVPEEGENRGVTAACLFGLTGVFMLLIGVYIVMSFLQERKNGLSLLVRCTVGGRLRLTLTRIFILVAGISAAGILLFSVTVIIGQIIFPSNLLRPIQSIPEFSGVVSHASVPEYLALFLFRMIIACITVMLALYFCMSLFRSGLCILLFMLFALGEFLLYVLLLPTAPLCALKYINLYTMLFKGTDYGHYYNINLFGSACGTAKTSLLWACFALLFFAILCVFRYAGIYHVTEKKNPVIFNRIADFFSRHKPQLTPTLWELKKLLISQKALVILVLVVLVAASSADSMTYMDLRVPKLLEWYDYFYGEVNEQKVEEIQKKIESTEKKKARYESARERLLNSIIKYEEEGLAEKYSDAINYAWEQISTLEEVIAEAEINLSAMKIVKAKADKGLDLLRTRYIKITLMDTTGYDLLLKDDRRTVKMNYLYVLIASILMFSGIMSFEKTSHMDTTLHTLYNGRKRLLTRKLVIVLICSIFCTLSIHLIQFFQINSVMPYDKFSDPVQSITCMMDFPIKCSITAYLTGLYTVRCLISYALSLIVMLLSSNTRSRVAAIAFGTFFLVIPVVLM